jgi:hypothetical protein
MFIHSRLLRCLTAGRFQTPLARVGWMHGVRVNPAKVNVGVDPKMMCLCLAWVVEHA